MVEPVNRDELLADMQRVDEQIDDSLTQKRYNDLGEYSVKPAKRIFGTWREACEAAGIETSKKGPNQLTDEDVLDDLRRVADQLGKPPSLNEYAEHGNHGTGTLQRRFGGIKNAREQAGLGTGPTRYRKPTEDELLDELRRIAEDHGEPVTYSAVDEFAEWTGVTYLKRFGSFVDAVEEAGLEALQPGGQPGELNSNWAGGYEPYYGENWYQQRRRALERDDHQCRVCGLPEEEHVNKFNRELEVHHIIRFGSFDVPKEANRLDNLISLCMECHRRYEHLGEEGREELEGLLADS